MKGQFTTTKDGSISFRDFSEHAAPHGETMHSDSGALSESLYVYLPCFENALLALPHTENSLKVCTVGLGLGYLEMITAARYLKFIATHQSQPETSSSKQILFELQMTSYESNLVMVETAIDWLAGNASSVHEKICADISSSFGLHPNVLFEFLQWLKHKGQWIFAGRLTQETLPQLSTQVKEHENAPQKVLSAEYFPHLCFGKHHAIYYDAYSEKTSPELWTEDFLVKFLRTHAHPKLCTFASYASRSAVKRALQSCGFMVPKRKGFMQKRECTLAQRLI